MSKGKARHRGQARPRTARGLYRRCRTWGCHNGWIKVGRTGERAPHSRCGGDGWIKVGQRRAKRRRRAVKLAAGVAAATTFYNLAGHYLGVVGQVAAVVVLAVVLVVKIAAFVLRGVGAVLS